MVDCVIIHDVECNLQVQTPSMKLFQLSSGVACIWVILAGFYCDTALGQNGKESESKSGLDDKKLQFFESRIRPVLIKHCYQCHAADSKEIKGGLRLDTKAALKAGGDSGTAIVAGKPDESLLMEALHFDGIEMPPAGKLPANIISDFEKWILDGATDPRVGDSGSHSAQAKTMDIEAGRKFWAFQPIARPVVPDNGAADPIDAFILRKLKQSKLQPNSTASKRQLIRRLYFDLTGLPPEPEDVQAFVNDSSDGAFEKLVDRLLKSQQFGVHWGRHWLDVARYADSNGGDFNATFHNAWRYRDYVVNAFNEDKPFDQFVQEQLAGDLLPYEDDSERSEKIIGTGFLMLGAKMLSERDKPKMTMDVVDEQINTVGQAFLGLTLGCSRCHDHKFDPIPTKDYYALAGIFKSTRTLEGESQKYVSTWPRRSLPANPELVAAVERFNKEKKAKQDLLNEAKQELTKNANQAKKLKQGFKFILIDDSEAKKTGFWKSSTISPEYVGKGYIHDDKSEKGEKWVEFELPIKRSGKYEVQISYNSNSGRDPRVPVSIKHALGEKEILVNQQKKPAIENLFHSLGNYQFDASSPARLTVSTRGTELYVIVDAVRLIELNDQGKPIQSMDQANQEKIQSLANEEKQIRQKVKELETSLKDLEKRKPAPLPQAIAVEEAKQIDDCEIRIRGEHQNVGPKVPRGFVQVVSSKTNVVSNRKQSGRLELAKWITDSQNPLTARVYANRIWHHLFGRGIVSTVDNFGALGDRPSHPDLLDYLAARLIENGWSTKKLIREIVLSQAYRRSTQHSDSATRIDPANRLLWRANRKRVTAESIRDSMLAIGGNLDRTPGPSPVAGLGTLVTQNSAEQTKFKPRDSSRRSIYLPMIRAELPEFLTIFDMADPDLVTGKRSLTNVPGQALLLLNSPFVMAQADNIAARILESTPGDPGLSKQINDAYLLVLSREPTKTETDRARRFLEAHSDGKKPQQALSRLIHTMLASTEFRTLN